MKFEKGERVKSKFGNIFHHGYIKEKHESSVYTVVFDDGDIYELKESCIVKCVDEMPPEVSCILKKLKMDYCKKECDIEYDAKSECSPRGITESFII